MNINFGKLENGQMTYAPDAVKIISSCTYEWDDEGDGTTPPVHHVSSYPVEKIVFPPTAQDYLSAYNGPFLPNENAVPTPEAGYHTLSTSWTSDGTKNIASHTYEKDARVFSKLRLEMTLFQMGLLDTIDAFVDSQQLSNEFGQSIPIRRLYDAAEDFAEDHPLFAPYLKQAQDYADVDDDTLETILDNSLKID